MPDETRDPTSWTHAGLERLRKRLLDLSNRNKLLNYRHRGKGCLRVVDELPDVLYQRLLDDTVLTFKPIPEPKPQDYAADSPERTVELYTPTGQPEQGNDSKRPARKPTPREYAAKIGIRPAFDLPEPEEGTAAKHQDNFIQTLHYASELDTILRRIHLLSRTAIEECGTNMLFMVFGFLEWYEEETSDEPLYAPLIMVPVTLAKKAPHGRAGMFEYTVTYSEEDLMPNLSLMERLKDYGIDLPPFDEEQDTPEGYFTKVRNLRRSFPKWQVRRYATLSMLQFGKLLMFLDLAPQRWPNENILSHHLVKDFCEGSQHDEVSYSSDYTLDDPEYEEVYHQLIYDADSSQHSALLDALKGRNLVIQGPPGTGKSQTITNLIAAALAEGKRVLFIAEKMAALEVVQRRLEGAGLGHFCLELHSHKTQKKELLADLERRIKAMDLFTAPESFESKLASLRRQKRELIEYVTLLNTRLEVTGETIYTLLWRHQCCLQRCPYLQKLGHALLLPSLPMQNTAEMDQVLLNVDVYQQHLAELLNSISHVSEHPWYGIAGNTNRRLDAQTVSPLAEALQGICNRLLHTRSSLVTQTGYEIEPTIEALTLILDWRQLLPTMTSNVVAEWIPKCIEDSTRQACQQFIKQVNEWRTHRLELLDKWGTAATTWSSSSPALVQQLLDWGFGPHSIKSLQQDAEELRTLIPLLGQVEQWLAEMSKHLGMTLPATLDSLEVILKVTGLLHGVSRETLAYRDPIFLEPALNILRQTASAGALTLRQERSELSTRFRVDSLPSAASLADHAKYLISTSWLGRWFSRDYRAARALYRELCRQASDATPQVMASALWDMAEHLDRRRAFERSRDFQQGFGRHWRGLSTPFEALARTEEWMAQVRQEATSSGSVHEHVLISLFSTELTSLELIQVWRKAHADTLHSFESLPQRVRALLPDMGADQQSTRAKSLSLLRQDIHDHVTIYENCAAQLISIGLSVETLLEDVPLFLEATKAWQDLGARLDQSLVVRTLVGQRFLGGMTVLEPICATLDFVARITAPLPGPLRSRLLTSDGLKILEPLQRNLELLEQRLKEWHEAWDSFSLTLGVNLQKWLGRDIEHSLPAHEARIRRALGAIHTLSEWAAYVQSQRPLFDAGIGILVDMTDTGALKPDQLIPAYEFLVLNTLTQTAMSSYPQLDNFSRIAHERIRDSFAKLDAELIRLYQQRAAYLINRRDVPVGNGTGPIRSWTDLRLLKNEMTKQRKHIPIRQLIGRAGEAIQALKPCFMMSPMSVAQYLAPGRLQFDLVVMDEASQLRPEEAIGAIARAEQVVIVGDALQLPPTSFFDTLVDAEDEEDAALAIEDSESILEIAQKLYHPTRQLRWHYRSRHESLIAYSNYEFYDQQLVVFPSPHAQHDRLGVKYHRVPDGIYDHRKNHHEAEVVVEAIVKHAEHCPEESLGVVTLNSTQRDLVEEIYESRLKNDPMLQAYIERYANQSEPFFVKNLETVQGDERDVIFISVTFGKDRQGNFYQRFGPINGINGHRRLNVLFTRAKFRTEVFSSLDPEDILLTPTSQRGLRAFRGFLVYAKTGVIEQPKGSQGPTMNPFEEAVSQALKSRGYDVVSQVGAAGYLIDLAIRHPHKLGSFLLGIECDGATYHSARSARDRDRLREQNLRNLKWKLYRIWSTDWFRNPEAELERLIRYIEGLQHTEGQTVRP